MGIVRREVNSLGCVVVRQKKCEMQLHKTPCCFRFNFFDFEIFSSALFSAGSLAMD